ncbi:MAG: transporter substrate-binding domain-containing protein [Gallintestinimicrobium sp.]
MGYDVEVAKLIANELGVDVSFCPRANGGPGLARRPDDGRCDIMVNGVGCHAERQGKIRFFHTLCL